MTTETFRFQLGAFSCLIVNDGYIDSIPRENFFSGGLPDELQQAFNEYDIPEGNLRIPCGIMLIDTGTDRVLVDTGAGVLDEGVGYLLAGLQAEDIAPEDITTVILSHGHYDHVGGNIDGQGNSVFTNARFFMTAGEFKYWMEQPEYGATQRSLDGIKSQLELIEPNSQIIEGIRTLHTPGHTYFHTSVEVRSGDEVLICIVDVADHPIHADHPTWVSTWEVIPQKSVETRRDLFQQCAEQKALVHGFHFPFPGMGTIKVNGDVFSWENLA